MIFSTIIKFIFSLLDCIKKFMELGINMKSGYNNTPAASWLFAVPLCHFLSYECQPYGDVLEPRQHRTPEWYGLQHIVEITDRYKFLVKNEEL